MENLFKKLQFDPSNWKNSVFVLNFIKCICILNIVLVINHFATNLATKNSGTPTGDFLFNLLPYVNTSFIDSYVTYSLSFIIFFLVIFYSKHALQLLNSLSLLIFVRSIFINLTYLGIPEGIEPTKSFFTQGGDLFFSGHTALPFLVALVFWENKIIRYFFLFVTVCMATEVLLGRYHYSIDVFAAPFITYCVFAFVKKFLMVGDGIIKQT